MSNYPAGAWSDPRAPWWEEDTEWVRKACLYCDDGWVMCDCEKFPDTHRCRNCADCDGLGYTEVPREW